MLGGMNCPHHTTIQTEALCELQQAADLALSALAATGHHRAVVIVVDQADLSHHAMGVESIHPTSLIALLEAEADRLRAAIGAAPRHGA
jgi:hypothetical protein